MGISDWSSDVCSSDLLVFKDTLLSLVASTQMTSNDMLRIGDWIEMPQAGADGFVIDIALHTVKIQNWDKTVTTVPTYKLFSESRSEEHTYELQSLMRNSYAVFCLTKKKKSK